jgi:2',3'-cyclic-nucleotide 2'-phosphodiesterase (5'-nucleotidase family)
VITNGGGIRQGVDSGYITKETPISILPLTNSIYKLKLSGNQVKDCIQTFCIGGYSLITNRLRSGKELDPEQIYTVLTTDYLYSIETTNFKKYDLQPVQTGILYRQPLEDYIKSLKTDNKKPLNHFLDTVPRITKDSKNNGFH